MAFIDMGDQFLALSEGRTQEPDAGRHFGLVVDDREAVREAAAREGLDVSRGRSVRFRDPWGNQFEVVDYADVQFERAPGVKRKLGMRGAREERGRAARDRRARARRAGRLTVPSGALVLPAPWEAGFPLCARVRQEQDPGMARLTLSENTIARRPASSTHGSRSRSRP